MEGALRRKQSAGGEGIKSGSDDEQTRVTVPIWHVRGRGSLVWEEAPLFGVTAPVLTSVPSFTPTFWFFVFCLFVFRKVIHAIF